MPSLCLPGFFRPVIMAANDCRIMNKTATQKQIAANRANALKSTGPKTPEGRAASKMNALKHGIRSEAVVVRGYALRENLSEFTELHERFVQDLNPVGVIEEMLVDQVVTAHWRLRRVLVAEAGEIVLSTEADRRQNELNLPRLFARWNCSTDPIRAMQNCMAGSAVLEAMIGELRTSVEQAGELTQEAIDNVASSFGGVPNHFIAHLPSLKTPADAAGADPAALKAEAKEKALAYLRDQLRDTQYYAECAQEPEQCKRNAEAHAAVLPGPRALDKILRYEAALERQLYRAMTHLERLQRTRQAESVPAPRTVEVPIPTPPAEVPEPKADLPTDAPEQKTGVTASEQSSAGARRVSSAGCVADFQIGKPSLTKDARQVKKCKNEIVPNEANFSNTSA